MRKELELMQLIENYLNGTLSETDKHAFEKRMQTDNELQKEVGLQQDIIKGIERAGLRRSATTALKQYKFKKGLRNWGLTGLGIAIISTSSLFLYNDASNHHKENAVYDLPELNEQGEKLWSDADKYLPLQSFELNTEKDTVVETKDGIVIAIPAHSFLTDNGQLATGTISLEVKEALHANDILKAGLNTKSGDQLLETGGMFYINARQDKASLKINPENGLRAQIPTNEVKPGMQLFEGKRMPDGTIDWVNPKPVAKDLIPVDILSLNFYPPYYLDSLRSWGYNDKDKKFTDSLYYSFARKVEVDSTQMDRLFSIVEKHITNVMDGERIFKQNCKVCHDPGSNKITGPGLRNVTIRVPGDDWLRKWIKNNEKLIVMRDPYAVKISSYDASKMTIFESTLSDEDIDKVIAYLKYNDARKPDFENFESKGISPAKIKAIWDKQFQNTFLATKEFEERMAVIHKTCDEDILNQYVQRLDYNLSSIDSIVAYMHINPEDGLIMKKYPTHPEFLKFAARGDRKVKNGDKNTSLLKNYYEKKSRLYSTAINKTQNEFLKKQRESDKEAMEKNKQHGDQEVKRKEENYKNELRVNLKEAYRQLGNAIPTLPISNAVYSATINLTGWNNVDKYVAESIGSRTNLDYIDPITEKKAIINYEPMQIKVNNYANYDRVLVYLLPDELNSFMRLQNKNDIFEEKVTNLMIYKLVCIAYKGEESFYYSQDNVKTIPTTVSLIKTNNEMIQNNINRFEKLSQVKAMNDEIGYIAFQKREEERKVQLEKIKELTNKVRPVIFPCLPLTTAVKDTSKATFPK